jgi:hypothetical protein
VVAALVGTPALSAGQRPQQGDLGGDQGSAKVQRVGEVGVSLALWQAHDRARGSVGGLSSHCGGATYLGHPCQKRRLGQVLSGHPVRA